MKDLLKDVLKIFVLATTGSLIAAMVIICLINGLDMIESAILWQLLVVSALCGISTLIFHIPGKYFIPKLFASYITINGIVIGLGVLFGWFRFESVAEVLVIVLIIAAVYAGVTICAMISSRRESDAINEKLKNRRK